MARRVTAQIESTGTGALSTRPSALSSSRARPRRARSGNQVGVSGVAGWAFVSPSLFGLLIFTLIPAVLVILLSLAHWDLISGFKGISWAG